MFGAFWTRGFFLAIPLVAIAIYIFSLLVVFPLYAIIFFKKVSGHEWDFVLAPAFLMSWMLVYAFVGKVYDPKWWTFLPSIVVCFVFLLIVSAGVRFGMKDD